MLQTFWTEVVSSHDQHGKSCALARDLLFLLSAPNQVSGSMAGSTTRLPLPNSTFGRRGVLAHSCPADQAHLRSHSGPASCAVLHGAPTGPEFKLAPDLFRTLVLERMRSVSEAHCECGSPCRKVEVQHRLLNGLSPVCAAKQATATLREMNISVAATDHRAIEVLASGLSTPPRCPIGCGHHHSVRSHSRVSSMPQCRDHERSRFASGACTEGHKICRTPCMGTVAVWLWSAWRRAGDGVTRRCSSSRSWRLARPGKHLQ